MHHSHQQAYFHRSLGLTLTLLAAGRLRSLHLNKGHSVATPPFGNDYIMNRFPFIKIELRGVESRSQRGVCVWRGSGVGKWGLGVEADG